MKKDTGVFQLKNGNWGYRITQKKDGQIKYIKRTKDKDGNKLITKANAIAARREALKDLAFIPQSKPIERKTVEQIYLEYSKNGRLGKAETTIRKQDSLWKNHIRNTFGNRYIDEISVAEVNDYLSHLYYEDMLSFSYVEGFLKMFYLIFGQAYDRNYLSSENYNRLCITKSGRITMPKRRLDDSDDVVVFSPEEMILLDEYFKGTNAETAYMLGKHCGLRINECYGLQWDHVDFNSRSISIDKQMYYNFGLIKLSTPKTKKSIRTIYMSDELYDYLFKLSKETDKLNKENIIAREQHSTMVIGIDGEKVSSLSLVNTLPNGKIQTVNSMKFHSQKIKSTLGITFKYHYLRHTYGTRLADLNTPTHILCNQMGHASSKVTEMYYLAVSKRGIDILISNLNKL